MKAMNVLLVCALLLFDSRGALASDLAAASRHLTQRLTRGENPVNQSLAEELNREFLAKFVQTGRLLGIHPKQRPHGHMENMHEIQL